MIKTICGLKIYYEVVGSGAPVLLLHGWANDAETMRPMAGVVKDLGFRVFSIDLPGFGLSDMPEIPWGVDDYVNLVAKLLDELAIEQVSIIAHSFGGRIAIKLGAFHPKLIDKLILVDSAGIKPARSMGYWMTVSFTKLIRGIIRFLPKPIDEFLRLNLLSKMGSRDYRNAGKLRDTFVKVVNEDLRQYLPSLIFPVLLVWGELDGETPLSDGRLMERLIPNSQLEVIQGAGHHCFLENPEAFLKIITPFLVNAGH
jgi:pimeloyl-ACP methyl ester carboxylesterase